MEKPSIYEEEVVSQIQQEEDWRTPIYQYLSDGALPEEQEKARKIRIQGARFAIMDGELYKRGYARPLLRCLGPEKARYAMEEVHEGICGEHLGARALAAKVLRAGFYWPSMKEDALEMVRRCDKCQRNASIPSAPVSVFQGTVQPIPFAQWGLDILGPFPQATGQRKFLIVATDYFTKWIEAEPLATITAKKVEAMVWKDIICRFGVPRILNTDHGKQFDCDTFREFCQGLRIQLRISSVSYPQANGQAEVSNRTILHGLRTRLEKAKGAWVDELPNVLWAYRTTSRVGTGETPFSLVYGTEALIPVEIGAESLRYRDFQEEANNDALREELDWIDERRGQAGVRLAAYHRRIARYYNSRVKDRVMQEGDLVLRRSSITNAAREEGKLRANWEGPYRIRQMIGPGTCMLQTLEGKRIGKTWNTSHLKLYLQ